MSLFRFSIVTLFTVILSLQSTVSSVTLRIQSFGRIAPLGSLYDARTASFIPGSTIFKPSFVIPKEAMESKQVTLTQLHVHPLDSTYSKFNEEDFTRATILSVLSGQIKTEGSWRYLMEEPRGQSVRFKTELKRKWKRDVDLQLIRLEDVHTHMRGEMVSMPHSVVHHFAADELLLSKNVAATHFVVGISYGKSITAIFEDQSRVRKYGMDNDVDHRTEPEEIIVTTKDGMTHGHNIVRLYTDNPLHSGMIADTPEQLEQHFFEFDSDMGGPEVPLLYDLIPLSAVVTYLEVNDTIRALLAHRWSPQFNIGDPYIEPLKMVPIYKEFDGLSILQYRLNEAMDMLRDPEFEHLVTSRRKYMEKIHNLTWKFDAALEVFKANLRRILTDYRYGRFTASTFENAMDQILAKYKRDEYSVENVTKILDTQFQGLQVAMCVEKLERTVGNLYGTDVDHYLKSLGKLA